MIQPKDEFYLLPRLGWMLYDDINRRLSILIEECLHLQQVVHYHGDFNLDIPDGSEQPKMAHFKDMKPEVYLRYPPTTSAMMALYEHLGALTIGLKSHQTEVRTRYECFLELNQNNSKNQYESWFWFIALRGHLLHEVIEKYMLNLEHAHEKLIQILETKPGALPQPILLRRWNSGLHGHFLSGYSRHIGWETNILINRLKKDPLDEKDLRKERHRSSFIHSWAHTPTSMVNTFKVKDKNFRLEPPEDEEEKLFFLGNIRSAFFYLEIPLLYPLLYHECAHLQFDWYSDIKNDKGMFFSTRNLAANSLEESAQQLGWGGQGFWDNFTEEIWVDMIALKLGGLPYLTALVMQIMGQNSGRFFHSTNDMPLNDWAKQPIYDLETPTDDKFFWETRLKLAVSWLKEVCPHECETTSNMQWIEAIKVGMEAYQKGGKAIFSSKHLTSQHENLWRYRDDLNHWVYKTIEKYQTLNYVQLKEKQNLILSEKYWVSEHLINDVIFKVVDNFETKLFKGNGCSYGNGDFYLIDEHGDKKYKIESHQRRIEYLPFHIKWYLSKRVIRELYEEFDQQKKQTFTFAYANYIRNDGSAAFRIALEWIIARIDLTLVFADYLENPELIQPHMDKLIAIDEELKSSDKGRFLEQYLSLTGNLSKEDSDQKDLLILHLRYQKSYNFDNKNKSFTNETEVIETQLKDFINYFMDEIVDKQFAAVHATQECAKIGTFTMGVLAKHRMGIENETPPYLNTTCKVHKYYQDILHSLNNPKISEKVETKVAMPHDHSNNKPFSYDQENSWLHFITGDYDFIHYQEGITPAESIIHPCNTLAMLTKSRTILDLFVSSQYKKRLEWGRVSLIKFRYRWEMYILSKSLKDKQNEDNKAHRTRLMLSSAWEHGVLITWHESCEELWNEAFYNEINGDVRHGTMDAQTNLLSFKLEEIEVATKDGGGSNKVSNFVAKSCDGQHKIDTETNKPDTDQKLLGGLLNQLRDDCIIVDFGSTTGRFDYVIEWKAKTPHEFASTMCKLPSFFWQNIDHINTTLREKGNRENRQFYFFSEISVNLLKNNIKPQH